MFPKRLSILLGSLWLPSFLMGENAADITTAVEKTIPRIARISEPPDSKVFPWGIKMAVSTNSLVVQDHVLQGLNHLHGGWESEASRHFAQALAKDPDCLMAHWGMVMALITPTPENGEARESALARMLELIEADMGSDLERGYAYGITKYFSEGPTAAASAFEKVAKKYPNEMQAAIFSALFGRGGYDEFGYATPDQEKSEYALLKLAAAHPDSAIPNHALLTIRAEAPDLEPSIKLAKAICEKAPNYPPFIHLLGHYQWRSGKYGDAQQSFAKASDLYGQWMKKNRIPIAFCPEKIRSDSYRIIAAASAGETENAFKEALDLADTPIDDKQLVSPGYRMLWWEGKTLPARVGHLIGTVESMKQGLEALPTPEEVKASREFTQACWWIDGLRLVLTGLIQVKEGELDEARKTADAVTMHGEMMIQSKETAQNQGELTLWTRGFRSLEVLASQLRGEIAMAGPPVRQGAAYNWFASARDRQSNSPVLLPPSILFPMGSKLGDFQMLSGRPAEAADTYQRVLDRFPGDIHASEALIKAKAAADTPEE